MTLVLITGATRGIGQAAAVELARQGAEVALVGRDPERVRNVAEEARAAARGAGDTAGERAGDTAGERVHEHVADLSSMVEVRHLAEEVRGRYEHIDVLANNAGALFHARKLTHEGFERTFALNHLSPFLLTNLLRDRLAGGPLSGGRVSGGRVVTTASDAHESGVLDLEDLQSERSYRAMRVYGTTKLCNILFTRELSRRAPELHAN
ncbi:MAG TPA: SDR family NAD(P)-dependent oxidoreductase, partial [Solirubrobacteraceae bacterium]|nr:SDR family NAD(P)-dependent oxidoreductase [Solirubrobacteraceae bacterium]